jgi:ribosomal protein S18 acetylase RimI-like enzyme
LGIYQNRPDEVEICGMVRPAKRRRGIFTQLLEAALVELRRRRADRVLLIVDRSFEAGTRLAESRGASIAWSEYRMLQTAGPELDSTTATISLRPGSPADVEFVSRCICQAFDLAPEAIESESFADRAVGSIVIEHDGAPIGTIRAEVDGETAGIYGFAVLREHQGRGYGRAALARVCGDLRLGGVKSVHLEVLVDNPGALHLYETCGFATLGVEDYWLLPSLMSAA